MEEMPVFVKIEDYQNIVDILRITQDKLKKAKALMERINELKEQEDSEINSWSQELEDIDQRLDDINKTLLEPNVQ